MGDQTKTKSASNRKGDETTDVAMAASDAESSDWEIAGANDEQRNEPEQPEQHAAPTRRRRPAAPVLEKDAEEEDLERLVLGDNAHFRALLFASDTVDDAGVDLQDLSLAVAGGAEGEDDDDNDEEAATGFEEADDMQMFFQDEALQVNTSSLATTKGAAEAAATTDKGRASAFAWEDSDDERLAVSLASASRLRKLRRTEGEDIVSGAEYAARLRQQYLRLHPQPAWAAEAYKRINRQKTTATKKKRRKSRAESGGSSSSDEDGNRSGSGSGSSSDDETEDALPLDHFFRSASAMAGASRLVLTQQQGSSGGKGRRLLRPEVIDIQKTRDIPTAHTGPVGTLAFHPHHPLLLSSSPSSVLHLHHIAPGAHPTPNPLLTAVRVRQTPVRRSAFVVQPSAEGAAAPTPTVVFAGRRPFFHTWDLATGRVQRVGRVLGHRLEHKTMERFRLSPTGAHMAVVATDRKGGGMLNVLDVATMQWVAQARLDSRGGLADMQWWRDGGGLTLLGRDGRVGEWRLAARRFVGTWRDEGSTGGTVLALGGRGGPAGLGGDRWVAVGSNSGIMNLYDRTALVVPDNTHHTKKSKLDSNDDDSDDSDSDDDNFTVQATPTPARVFEQLTTPVTALAFTPDGQLLAFASQHKTDALRLVHLPSCTVYRNWPTTKTPLGRITAVAFGKDSDLLAVGNDAGKTRLWEIRG